MLGKGVHDVYKERASKGGDVLWHVKIKGQSELTKGIKLHMSLKVFQDKKEIDLQKIKEKVKELKIVTPNPKKLKFSTTIFTSERDGKKYYMLLIDGVDENCKKFYEEMKHCGTVYKKFMPHVTIDKDLYDKINKEGLKASEIQFDDLSVEAGAGNTIYEFKKSEASIEAIRETLYFIENDFLRNIAINFQSCVLEKYLNDNEDLKKSVLKKHEDRVKFHFSNVPEIIEYAKENGIEKGYSLLKRK